MAAPTSTAPTVQRTFFVLATLVLVITILYFGRTVLLPIVLATLFSFILTPAVAWLERHRLPRTPAVLLVALVVFALLGGLGYFITIQVGQLAEELRSDKYQANMKARIDALPAAAGDPLRDLLRRTSAIEKNVQKAKDAAEEAGARPPEPPPEPRPANPPGPDLHWLTGLLPTAAEGLADTLLVIVLAVFMLVKRGADLRDRLIRLLGHGHLSATTRAIDEAGQRTSRYLSLLSLVNLTAGLILSAGFYLLGVPYPLLWGLLIGTMRFIPYIGVWLAALAPLLLSVATSAPGDWFHPLGVLGLILVLELLVSNLVEPVLYGRTMGISAVALLVSAAFWAWLWGPVGLVVAVPMTVCVAVLGKYVPQLKFFDILLRDEPVLSTPVRYYQRLLAHDTDEAEDMIEDYLKAHPWETVFDKVLLPALALARRDADRGELEAEERDSVYQTTREVLDDLVVRQEQISKLAKVPVGEKPAEKPTVSALAFPAHDAADELALQMLGQLLEPSGCRLEVFSSKSLAAEVLHRACEEHPAFVVVGALPPGGLAQCRNLCKRLRAACPNMKIYVVRWGQEEDLERVRDGLRQAGADGVVTTLEEARAQLVPLVQVAAAAHQAPAREPAGAGT